MIENVVVLFLLGGVVLVLFVLIVRVVGCDLFLVVFLVIIENVYFVLGFKFLIVMLFVVVFYFFFLVVILYFVIFMLLVDVV